MYSETRDDRHLIYLGKWTCWYIIVLNHAFQIKTKFISMAIKQYYTSKSWGSVNLQ